MTCGHIPERERRGVDTDDGAPCESRAEHSTFEWFATISLMWLLFHAAKNERSDVLKWCLATWGFVLAVRSFWVVCVSVGRAASRGCRP